MNRELLENIQYKNNLKLDKSYEIKGQVQIVSKVNSSSITQSSFKLLDSSELDLLLINDEKKEDVEYSIDVEVSSNAHFNIDIINTNAASSKLKLSVNLNGNNANANINVLDIALDKQDMIYDININNNHCNTEANTNFKVISANNTQVMANINAHINKNSENSKNFQTSKAILLNDSSNVTINPILLIDNGKVQASHTVDISPIPDEELYYLMSRGIKRELAEKLVISAFIKSQIDLLAMKNYQEMIEQTIFSELEK